MFARYFKAIDRYNRLNITNGNLYREYEKLARANKKLSCENDNLRTENKDYKLLRKVFGSKQIDALLERTRLEKQFNSVMSALEKITIMKGRNTQWETEFTMRRTVFGRKSRRLLYSLSITSQRRKRAVGI